jgi:Fur family ferric uptake transcriptional regulator
MMTSTGRLAMIREMTEKFTALRPEDTPADPERIENLCVEKGMRMTDQRRVIARVLSVATDHPDVEEVYRRAAAVDNKISIATVYRTVRLFEEAGILERHDFRDGRSRYEQVQDEHHDHLIDLQTGTVIEFHNEEIERLQQIIARELGYELVDHRLELYGVPLNRTKKPEAGNPE